MVCALIAQDGVVSAASVNATAARLVARYGTLTGATMSETRLLLSYKAEAEVVHFYDFVEHLVQEYGSSADLSVAEARDICRTPANVRERGDIVLDFLKFVTSTVERYKKTAGASASEVKSISVRLHKEEITEYYSLVERLCATYGSPPAKVKLLLSVTGQAATEDALRREQHELPKHNFASSMPGHIYQDARWDSALCTLGFKHGERPSASEVSHRYRQLAKVWHPDKHLSASTASCSEEEASQRFRDIKEAADLLLLAS